MSKHEYLEYLQAYCREVCDFFLDFRYGGYFGGRIKTRFAHLGAHDTASGNYSVLSCIFRKYKIEDSDVLVDVGCGKGRVINWWLKRGHKNRMIGIELDEIIADQTRKRFEKHGNVEIFCCNALEKIPGDGTVFFLYNPFDRSSTRAFKDRLKEEAWNKDRVRIIYANCEHIEAFSDDLAWTIYTNTTYYKRDPQWKELDIDMSYPVAVLELKELKF